MSRSVCNVFGSRAVIISKLDIKLCYRGKWKIDVQNLITESILFNEFNLNIPSGVTWLRLQQRRFRVPICNSESDISAMITNSCDKLFVSVVNQKLCCPAIKDREHNRSGTKTRPDETISTLNFNGFPWMPLTSEHLNTLVPQLMSPSRHPQAAIWRVVTGIISIFHRDNKNELKRNCKRIKKEHENNF